MDRNKDLVYVPELAKLLGTTECAVRTRLARGNGVPPRYKNSTKVCWLITDVDKFIADGISAGTTAPLSQTKLERVATNFFASKFYVPDDFELDE